MSSQQTAGLGLHVEEAGQGAALLLIHGLGGSSGDWAAQIAAFSRSRHVIAPDLRGFGRSPDIGPYSVPQFADDLWDLLDQRGLRQVDIVGHSMGGAIAMQMSLQRPAAVRRLVLSNTLPDFRPRHWPHYLMVISRLLLMPVMGPAWLGRRSAERLYPQASQAGLRAQVIARSARNRRGPYLRSLLNLSRWSVAAQLHSLPMPLLVMTAEHDYFDAAAQQRFIDQLPPAAEVEHVAGAHHGLPLEAPERFNQRLSQFLDCA